MAADSLIRLARGLGRLAYRKHGETRGLHLVVADVLAQYPDADPNEVHLGWHREREEMREAGDHFSIGGGL